MEFKRIIVLANSIKRGGRCVAGREVGDAEGGAGAWLRPVSAKEDGTLMPEHTVVDTGRPLRLFDIVDVPLTCNANDRCHPEDWGLSEQEWRHVGRFNPGRLPDLEEVPRDLWLEDRSHTGRVTCGFLLRQKHHQSIYVIRPKNLRVRLSREFNEYKGYAQKKKRAVFDYGDVEYDLGLTDPLIGDRRGSRFPQAGAPPNELPLPCADECLLCVSLTPVFNGYHYKVVAAVLELPSLRGRLFSGLGTVIRKCWGAAWSGAAGRGRVV